MSKLLHNRFTYIALAVAGIAVVLVMAIVAQKKETVALVTATVERGTVEQLVSVSGVVEAEQTAELAFPVTGIVSEVTVTEGDVVEAGDVLISLEARALAADRADALAALSRAVATRDELAAGADVTTRAANTESIALKQATLETTRATQADLVQNAYRTLLSSNLEAHSEDPDEDAVAPIITGTYTCGVEGVYIMEAYASDSSSGYSYRLFGLEEETHVASFDQSVPLGECGLRAQFSSGSRYNNTTWIIDIPNAKSSQYVTNRNAYALAQTQADSAIAIAEQDLALAIANADSSNAPARDEAIARANADIASANARIARIDADLEDRIIRAPFAGTITEIDILPGETVTTAPVITILAAADFELTARIPEIDIGKLETQQRVRSVFDARDEETLGGTIDFISLKATEIDGVAYYEAIITLDESPSWLRSGLNADIDIIITAARDVLRLPRRFVTTAEDGSSTVNTLRGERIATTTVDVLLTGDDGFIAITGVEEGLTIVAPE